MSHAAYIAMAKAIVKCLRVTGGSAQWRGDTADFLKDMESCLDLVESDTLRMAAEIRAAKATEALV